VPDTSGLPGPIEEIFGIFEPRFYGVTLVLETERAYSRWAREVGVNPDAPIFELTPFEDVCMDTCDLHEVRHFHDSLISPFASLYFLSRLLGAWHGINMLTAARDLGANCFPTPVSAWVLKSEAERAAWISEAEALLPGVPLTLPPLPKFDRVEQFLEAPDLSRYRKGDLQADCEISAALALRNYKNADQLFRSGIAAPPYSARSVFEISALAAQIMSIDENFSSPGFQAFLKHLLASDMEYAQAWRVTSALPFMDTSSVPANQFQVSALAIWSMLGDPSSGLGLAPEVRLIQLIQRLAKLGWTGWKDDVAALWDEWDEHAQTVPWRDALLNMLERTEGFAKRFNTQANESLKAGRCAEEAYYFNDLNGRYQRDQFETVKQLLDDPTAYVDPKRYGETLASLPLPLLAADFGTLRIPAKGEIQMDSCRSVRVTRKDGVVTGWLKLVLDHAPTPRPELMTTVNQVESKACLADAVLFPGLLRPIDQSFSYLQLQRDMGLRPLFVF
jgi:hypothetical protein